MKYILALDQSTSATKALIFGENGRVVDQEALPHEQHYPQPGWVEHDAEEIYQNTIKVLSTLMARNTNLRENVAGLSVTNQRETFVIFDKATGTPLRKAIVWQCRRGESFCQSLVDAGHEARVHDLTGLKIDTYFPASKITWVLENEPSIKVALENGNALIGTIDAYLIYRLTGGQVFATDPTNASRTLLYDIHTRGWSDELASLFNVPLKALPEVRDCDALYGETTLDGHLGQSLAICGVMGDSQAALFAEHCFTVGSAKVTFGTGSSVMVNIGDQPLLADDGIVTAVAWQLGGQTTYAFEGILNFTGATIAWLRDQLRLIQSPKETQAIAEHVPDNGGVYLVPAFVGLSAPYWQPNAKAAIIGLTPSASLEHVVRAALESIGYQIRDIIDMMSDAGGIKLQTIHGDGGMVSNGFVMQFVADVCGLTVQASEVAELSALGAVQAGLLGLNIIKNVDGLSAISLSTVDYTPQTDAQTMQALYDGWRAAVQRVL